jgi:oligopeptide transport system substrate-binding protein
MTNDWQLAADLFCGLATLDADLNVLPAIARSWEVLEGGRRYIFHLRDDARWTDGSPVTASDFEYTWIRNLSPAFQSPTAIFLFDIVGAQEFHDGLNPDPSRIGVKALDPGRLEVRLKEPVAYFPYIITMPVTLPMHRSMIEKHGKTWWQPGNIVTNGAFRLLEINRKEGCILERNWDYFGEVPGNITRQEWQILPNREDRIRAFREGGADVSFVKEDMQDNTYIQDQICFTNLGTNYALFPSKPGPCSDVRVRTALAMAIDREEISRRVGMNPSRAALGGFIPPGMPGYTPGIGLAFDPAIARKYLAEAGFPNGQGFPELKTVETGPIMKAWLQEIAEQWQKHLNIKVRWDQVDSKEFIDGEGVQANQDFIVSGWIADYPDPDNFLYRAHGLRLITSDQDEQRKYTQLVRQAAITSNRTERMRLYRQADRMLVAEQVWMIPGSYDFSNWALVKPWVKNLRLNAVGQQMTTEIVIEEH